MFLFLAKLSLYVSRLFNSNWILKSTVGSRHFPYHCTTNNAWIGWIWIHFCEILPHPGETATLVALHNSWKDIFLRVSPKKMSWGVHNLWMCGIETNSSLKVLHYVKHSQLPNVWIVRKTKTHTLPALPCCSVTFC